MKGNDESRARVKSPDLNSRALLRRTLIWLSAFCVLLAFSCQKRVIQCEFSEIPRFGRHFEAIQNKQVIWVRENRHGYGIGRCEMSLDEFKQFVQTLKLDCQFILDKMETRYEAFSPYFTVGFDTKVYPASGQICPSERGCHFYGYFAPDGDSFTNGGVLFFFVQ